MSRNLTSAHWSVFRKEESDITLAFNFKAIQTETFVCQGYYSAYQGTNKMLENQIA